MRIVGGDFRGIKLKTLEGDSVRPTLDRVKEAIFNIIQFDVKGAKALDVFAGSGAMGIEAVSRGADKVVFNDISHQAIKTLKENCKIIKHIPVIYNLDFSRLYKEFSQNGSKFDIIFIDPPYDISIGEKAVEGVFENDLLSQDGFIVFEHLAEQPFKNRNSHTIIKSKKYGIVGVDIISK